MLVFSSTLSKYKESGKMVFLLQMLSLSVLFALNVTFHVDAHALILSRSEFSVSARAGFSLRLRYMLVSSANSLMMDSMLYV